MRVRLFEEIERMYPNRVPRLKIDQLIDKLEQVKDLFGRELMYLIINYLLNN